VPSSRTSEDDPAADLGRGDVQLWAFHVVGASAGTVFHVRLTLTIIFWARAIASWAAVSVTWGAIVTKAPPACRSAGALASVSSEMIRAPMAFSSTPRPAADGTKVKVPLLAVACASWGATELVPTTAWIRWANAVG